MFTLFLPAALLVLIGQHSLTILYGEKLQQKCDRTTEPHHSLVLHNKDGSDYLVIGDSKEQIN